MLSLLSILVTALLLGCTGCAGPTEAARSETSPVAPVVDTPPVTEGVELPRQYVSTAFVSPTGRTVRVGARDNLQTALDRAQRGDLILLERGATFTGDFVLKAKPGTGWITVATDTDLPPEGTRMTLELAAAAGLARIEGASDWGPTLQTARSADAGYYRVMGVEITFGDRATPAGNGGIVNLGDSDQSLAEMPSYLILDRVYVHGYANRRTKRCVTLNSAWSAVVDSYLDHCHTKGQDSQAIMGWNGTGPYKIANNYLAGGAENVMFGGADPSIPDLVPSDIEIRGNHFHRPNDWKGMPTITVKNLFELKAARRVLVEGNVFEGNWTDGQTGWAINLKSANQSGRCTWCVSEHVTIRYNVIRNSESGITILAKAPVHAAPIINHVLIEHNVLFDLGPDSDFGGRGGGFQLVSGPRDITIRHNTVLSPYSAVHFTGGQVSGLELEGNILTRGRFGIKGDGAPEGTGSLGRYAPGAAVTGNVIVGARANLYPPRNHFPGSLAALGFVDLAGRDLRLAAGSGFKGLLGGVDPGADVAKVAAMTSGVR